MASVPPIRSGGVRKCSVIWCKNTSGKKKGYGLVSLHRFPADQRLRKIWINRCVKGRPIGKSSTVCSMHFRADAFEGNLTEKTVGIQLRKCLRSHALPTRFLKQNEFLQSRNQSGKTKSALQKFKPKPQQSEKANKNVTESDESEASDPLARVCKVKTVSSVKRKEQKKPRQQINTLIKKTRKESIDSPETASSTIVKEETKTEIAKVHHPPQTRNRQNLNSLSRRKVRFNFNTQGRRSRVSPKSALKRNMKPSIKQEPDEKVSKFEPKVLLERIFIPAEVSTSKKKKIIYEADDMSNDFDLRDTMSDLSEPSSDPLDIPKLPELVKDAQKSLATTDVLICGGCHEVFYFIEEFQNHKDSKICVGKSVLKCENEEKAQIWGFTLWKTKQAHIHKEKGETIPTSWEIYQKWTKLQPNEKELWVTAGHNLQVIGKISTTKYKEVKEKDRDPLSFDDSSLENGSTPKRGVRSTSNDNERHEYNVEKIVGKRFNTRKHMWEYEVKWENYEQETWEPLSNLENCKALVQQYEGKIKALKEKDKTITPSGRGRGRPRVNPLPSGTITTPPVKLIKKSITSSPLVVTSPGSRPQRTSKQKALNQVKAWCGNISDEEEAKAKRALDDDEDEDDSDGSYVKRMKLEAESEDTEEEEEELKSPTRKVAKIIRSYHNGSGRKLPDNVLIPDAKGVVRISQKQLPSLSSGVYIMSRSSGIIKLDSTASKMATSGGQAIVTVSPKIGQTQIRIIKKEDGSKRTIPIKTESGGTSVANSNTLQSKTYVSTSKAIQNVASATSTNTLTPIKKPIFRKEAEKVLKKVESPIVKSVTPKPPIAEPVTPKVMPPTLPSDDESDDGIEEMEFPTDILIPEPESPPGDFVLDPITGKVAGVEYPDPEPEPVIIDQIKEPPTESIDNIVKLAAADITEEDLKTDETINSAAVTQITTTVATATPPPAPPITTTVAPVAAAITKLLSPSLSQDSLISPTIMTVNTKASITPKPSPRTTVYSLVSQQSKPKPSILNTALKNSNILQKTLQSPKPRTQPRIINQSVAKPKGTISPIVRPHTANQPRPQLVRPRPAMSSTPKPKFNISPPINSSNTVKHFYSKTTTPALKKVAHPALQKPKPPTPLHSTPVRKPSLLAKTPIPASTPKPVINMPSLDDEPALVLATSTKAEQVVEATVAAAVETDISTFTLATTDDRPMFITGDDGTVYQVAGQNEEGQTILVTQDSDGQQQCLLVTNDSLQDEVEEQVEFPSEIYMAAVQEQEAPEAEDQPVVAQFLRTEPLSPGGTCRVVVRLPDGEVMVTQVSPEEYASLSMDK